MSDASEARRQARAAWPVRRFALGHEPIADLSATTTVEERLAMVEALTQELWSLAGRESPSYSRAQAPVSRRPSGSPRTGDER